jgi:hypothetical protein
MYTDDFLFFSLDDPLHIAESLRRELPLQLLERWVYPTPINLL